MAYLALLPLGAATAIEPGRVVDEVGWKPVSALPEPFTMRDLRTVHELMAGQPHSHETNFWRQMTTRWHLEETGEYAQGRGRPAALYRRAKR